MHAPRGRQPTLFSLRDGHLIHRACVQEGVIRVALFLRQLGPLAERFGGPPRDRAGFRGVAGVGFVRGQVE